MSSVPDTALAFCHRECRWNDGRSRMRLGHRLEVVGLVRVREHPVRERGVDRCRADVGREYRRLCRSALSANVARGHDAGRQHGAGDHRADACRGCGSWRRARSARAGLDPAPRPCNARACRLRRRWYASRPRLLSSSSLTVQRRAPRWTQEEPRQPVRLLPSTLFFSLGSLFALAAGF